MRNLKPSKRPKIIVAVDFDGTLVKNKYPYISNPNTELIDFILSHRERVIWILWTCRHDEQLEYATKYLKDTFGLEFDYVNENCKEKIMQYGETRKVYADVYIDDNNGSIERVLELIK